MIDKPVNRRGILGFILGGAAAAAAPPAVTVKTAAAALGVSTAMSPSEIVEAASGPSSGLSDIDWMLINRVESMYYARSRAVKDMPSHISSKKSWSPVYKASVFAREEAIMRAYLDRLKYDKPFLAAIREALGLGGSDDT